MVTIRVTERGTPVAEQFGIARDDMRRAATIAIAGATEGAKLELRKQLKGSNGRFDRMANAIQARVFPKAPRSSFSAAGSVYSAGDAADRAFAAFSTGVVVTPVHARALAIPLHGARDNRGRLFGPNSSFFRGRLQYIPPRRRGTGLVVGILATPDPNGQRKQKRKLDGRRAEVADHMPGGWVPQFILVRSARLPKLMSPEEVLEKWGAAIPGLIDQNLREAE